MVALWYRIYLPNLLVLTGQGAIIPVLAIYARRLGASSVTASVIVAMIGLGTLAFDVPAGWIVGRLGEQRAGRLGSLALVGGVAIALFARDPLMLGTGVVVSAAGWAIWLLVRLTYMTRATSYELRGRALSLVGGVMRAGAVAGPFLVVAFGGSGSEARTAFVIYFVAAVAGCGWLELARDRLDLGATARETSRLHPRAIFGAHRREFATAGVATFVISLLRASRQVVIPLWGIHIGLGVSRVSLIFGISSIVELAIFYPAGVLSDRRGRVVVALACIGLLSLGHALLPLTHAFDTLLLVSLLFGVGNGFGAGIVMAMGADRAPAEGRTAFLAVWRLVSDAGTSAGPLATAALIAVASLSLAGPALALVGLAAAVIVAGFMRDAPRRDVALSAPPNS